MKKMIAVLASALLATSVAFAEDSSTPANSADPSVQSAPAANQMAENAQGQATDQQATDQKKKMTVAKHKRCRHHKKTAEAKPADTASPTEQPSAV